MCHFENQKLRYLSQPLGNFNEILHGDAYWLNIDLTGVQKFKFLKTKMDTMLKIENQNWLAKTSKILLENAKWQNTVTDHINMMLSKT